MVARLQGDIEGLARTLKEVGKIDKSLRRALGKEIRNAADPLKKAAQQRLPDTPLSGWTSGRYEYSQAKARSGVKIKIGGRGRSSGGSGFLTGGTTESPLVTMVQSNAGGAVYDMAGRKSSGSTPSGRSFIAGLNRQGGGSRSMWPAAEEQLGTVEKAVEAAVKSVEKQANVRLRA
jgi:hypothetical protein